MRIFSDLKRWNKFNNISGKIIGFIADSKRFACVYRIRKIANELFAGEMADNLSSNEYL